MKHAHETLLSKQGRERNPTVLLDAPAIPLRFR